MHWEDWKPVAGENAWVAMAAMQLYHQKFNSTGQEVFEGRSNTSATHKESIELRLAEELARAALILQSETGGIRMAPIGTFRETVDPHDQNTPSGEWWYRQISSENNISWYAALRMLYAVTHKPKYVRAMVRIEQYFQKVGNPEGQYFYQGMNFQNGQWYPNNEDFALDVQTWGISCFGPEKIDRWFGEGTAYRMWQRARAMSGAWGKNGQLMGVGYIHEHDRVSVEWTAGAILAVRMMSQYYEEAHPDWARELAVDAQAMRKGIETLRRDLSGQEAAYSYSSRRDWIPFGWFSHDPEVLSLASTGWVIFIDRGVNPFFFLPKTATNQNRLAKRAP